MAKYYQVNPESFIDTKKKVPLTGRGAWAKRGIDFAGVYALNKEGETRIGLAAEKSLDHWAVAVGALDIQNELKKAGFDPGTPDGIVGPNTEKAIKAFQKAHKLTEDGRFGRMSARALYTPIIDAEEAAHKIPGHYLRGIINGESALDPGAVGYYIYYGDTLTYRGVDRGPGQINSSAHPQISWLEAFSFRYAAKWTADRLRTNYDNLKAKYPKTKDEALWDAAICAHNNPSAAQTWAKNGAAPTEAAATYVSHVKAAIY